MAGENVPLTTNIHTYIRTCPQHIQSHERKFSSLWCREETKMKTRISLNMRDVGKKKSELLLLSSQSCC